MGGVVSAGLGLAAAGTSIAIAAEGGTAAASGALVGVSAAIPIAGAVVAGLALLAGLIFHGADPRQVPASKIEQSFEAAADKLHEMMLAGMISVAQAVAGQQACIAAVRAMMDQYHSQLGDKIYSGTIANVTKVINDQIAQTQAHAALPGVPTTLQVQPSSVILEIDPNSASKYYPQDGTAGWYPESVQSGDTLVNHYLSTLPENFPVATTFSTAVASPVQAAKALVSSVAAGNKTSLALAVAMILALGFILKNLFK